MEESNMLLLSDIEEKLKSIRFEEIKPVEKSSVVEQLLNSPYIQAAAVLVFYDPDTLLPVSQAGILNEKEKKQLINELIGNSEMVLSSGKESFDAPVVNTEIPSSRPIQLINYLIKDDIRKQILKKLITEGKIKDALDANKAQVYNDKVLLQRMFTQYLLGNIPDFEKMNLQQLNELQRISEWLGETGITLPSKKAIQKRIEITELLTPFRHLTGSYVNGEFVEQFRGRTNELSVLRKYVGVAAPQGISESVQRYYQELIEPIFNWDKKPPLLIFGLGGVGKSTLVAKFILDHAEAHTINRFPFVYLDFDRPSLSVLEPETMLIESARQLSIQYMDDDKIAGLFSDFYIHWKNHAFISLEEKSTQSIVINANEDSVQLRHDRDTMLAAFIDLVQKLSAFEKKPFLIVIDTFEEVQYKGQECVKQLYAFMLQLQSKYSLLRVVVAGRAPVTEIKTQEMELGDLDLEAATGFLEKSGITDITLAKKIASRFGGNPLTLKLAADLVKKYGKEELEQTTLTKKKFFIFEDRLPEVQIQGILYRRILKHIHNPEVLKLAHPGLVLRQITSELIFKVLTKPCKLSIESPEEAEHLFNEMSKEVSLVTRINPLTVRHRADVRKVMLELIKKDSPAIVEEIHTTAVLYYQQQDGVMARAEEFYHRLCLNESPRLLDSRWMDGIQNYLLGSMDELPPKAQAFLSARTGVEISDTSIWEDADIEDWERRLVRQTSRFLNAGQAERALEIIAESAEHVTNSGILLLFKVRALIQLNLNNEAEQTATQTLNSYYANELNPKVKAELIKCVDKLRKEENTKSVVNESELPGVSTDIDDLESATAKPAPPKEENIDSANNELGMTGNSKDVDRGDSDSFTYTL